MTHLALSPAALRWDIFCQVIDNYGDLGVCWRLAAQLAACGGRVRLWVDDASALSWMAPQGAPGVQVLPWAQAAAVQEAGDVVIEAFGCEIAPEFIAVMARQSSASTRKPLWINLEYLSAESYVQRCHRLPSPLMAGPGAGLVRWFFYPGFTSGTGGLLRERGLLERQAAQERLTWRTRHGVAPASVAISLFCYEPPVLHAWLDALSAPAHVLVAPGRPRAAVQRWQQENKGQIGSKALPDQREQLSISYLEPVPQSAFDDMLWACDLNFVRGEDSLVRALWAGEALVWHIYPQHDGAHHAKLSAFLDWLQAPASLRHFHAWWNAGGEAGQTGTPASLPTAQMLQDWRACVQAARARLCAQDDLLTQLLGFIAEKS